MGNDQYGGIDGGTMRSPLTAMIFTLELTHDLNILPALLVSCIAAHALTVLLLRRSILTEKVVRHGYHVTREYSVDPLAVLRVGEVMDRDPPTVPALMKVSELSDLIAKGDPDLSHRQGTLIVDGESNLARHYHSRRSRSCAREISERVYRRRSRQSESGRRFCG